MANVKIKASFLAVVIFMVISLTANTLLLGIPVFADNTDGKIVFSGSRSSGNTAREIFIMDADGTNKVQLTDNTSSEYSPELSPDGTKIVFGESGKLYSMNVDGTNKVQVGTGTDEDDPSFSPDGTKIVFTSYRSGDAELFIMNADGTNETQLTSGVFAYSPVWSPDGTKIAYTVEDAIDQIYTINPDGSNPTQVTHNSTNSRDPSWSPDGLKLAYFTQESVGRIYTIKSDGTSNTPLTDTTADRYFPTWSPQGDRIAYTKQTSNPSANNIAVINIDGTNEVQLTDAVADGFADYRVPYWWNLRSPIPGDSDNDGIDNAVEAAAPNSGDANNDGIADNTQLNVSSFVNPVTNSYVSVQSSCTSNSNVSASAESNTFKDTGFDYPAGLVAFTLACGSPGATATIAVYFYDPPANVVARKYNSATHTYQGIDGAAFQNISIGGQSVLRVAYSIVDGGAIDQDMTANGTIVDPIGLGQSIAGAPRTGLGGGL